ncbi:MAG: hypothetical protein WDM87_15760 [Terracidiphilus sp.]
MFDHAIVYVPGKNPIWIDATDRYAKLGQIPMGDQGRLALITSATTMALEKTPESTSKDNGLAETREFTLTDNGSLERSGNHAADGHLRVRLSRVLCRQAGPGHAQRSAGICRRRSMCRTI